jgi:hypothetical protein
MMLQFCIIVLPINRRAGLKNIVCKISLSLNNQVKILIT